VLVIRSDRLSLHALTDTEALQTVLLFEGDPVVISLEIHSWFSSWACVSTHPLEQMGRAFAASKAGRQVARSWPGQSRRQSDPGEELCQPGRSRFWA